MDIYGFVMKKFLVISSIFLFFKLGLDIIINKKPDLYEILSMNLLRYFIAPIGLWAFIGHYFYPKMSAKSIGWKTCQFQSEVAFYNLATFVVGLMASFKMFSKGFRLSFIIVYSIFMLSAAFNHIKDMFEKDDFSPGNAGLMLLIDIITPIVMILLFYLQNYKGQKLI